MNFIKKLFYISIFLLNTSCGQNVFDDGVKYTKGEAFIINELNRCLQCEEMQNQFIKELSLNSSPIPIGFDTLSETRVGACYLYENGEPAFIKINPQFWNTITENVKYALIYHELGHCLLGLSHKNEYMLLKDDEYEISYFLKLSIMNATLMNPLQASFVKAHWPDYMIALNNDLSFSKTDNIEAQVFLKIYYEDIKESEFIFDSYKINEELLHEELCIDNEYVYRTKDQAIEENELGLSQYCN